jgi:hypothetical protein
MTGWSPGMRDEAAHGLVRLLARPAWRDSEHSPTLASTVESLLADPNPVARLQAVPGLPFLFQADQTRQLDAVRSRLLAETHPDVLTMLLDQLRRFVSTVPVQIDDMFFQLAQRPAGAFLQDRTTAARQDQTGQATEQPDGLDADGGQWSSGFSPAEPAGPLLAYLAVVPQTPFATTTLTNWFNDPIANQDRVASLLHDLRPYLNNRVGAGQDNAFRLLGAAAKAAAATWVYIRGRTALEEVDEPAQSRAREAALVARDIAQQLYFASGAFDDQPGAAKAPEAPVDLDAFARNALPILQLCGQVSEPRITQDVVQTLIHLTKVLGRSALMAVAAAVPARGAYLKDPHAAATIVAYLHLLLAEHRDLVLGDNDGIDAFRHLLQAFAGAGDADALSLAYTFGDVFR